MPARSLVVIWVKLSRGVVVKASVEPVMDSEFESCDIPAGVEEAKR